mmetsp:Transcript_26398/g.78393  ORF Transcript_26398/g.78393 Transcript_26398/m.78393 type:complete len:84 (+) Transcript_26398:202-453(+)|eukprot:364971-Chlamydomonas_euryale.AAC.3
MAVIERGGAPECGHSAPHSCITGKQCAHALLARRVMRMPCPCPCQAAAAHACAFLATRCQMFPSLAELHAAPSQPADLQRHYI